MTLSCIGVDVEPPMVVRTTRCARIRQVRCGRSMCWVLRVPGHLQGRVQMLGVGAPMISRDNAVGAHSGATYLRLGLHDPMH